MNTKTIAGLIVGLLLVGALVVAFNQQSRSPQQTTTGPTESVDVTVENEQEMTSDSAEEVTVTVTEDGFTPQALTVKKGTKVTWANDSGGSIQVSSAPHPQHTDYPPLNQRVTSDGQEVSFTFNEVGTFKYHDHLNVSRFGSVTVEE